MSVTEGREAWIAVEMWWMDLLAVRAWRGGVSRLVGQVMGNGKQRVGGQVMWWRADMKRGYKKGIIPGRRNGSAVARGDTEGELQVGRFVLAV